MQVSIYTTADIKRILHNDQYDHTYDSYLSKLGLDEESMKDNITAGNHFITDMVDIESIDDIKSGTKSFDNLLELSSNYPGAKFLVNFDNKVFLGLSNGGVECSASVGDDNPQKGFKTTFTINKVPEIKHRNGGTYDNYYWTAPKSEVNRMIGLMAEYEYTEDDYMTDNYEIQVSERNEVKPSYQEYLAFTDFMQQSGLDNHKELEQHRSVVDTGRYMDINIGKDIYTVYESVPIFSEVNGLPEIHGHELWPLVKNGQPVNTDASVERMISDINYDVIRTIPYEEAKDKYQQQRDMIAYNIQNNEGFIKSAEGKCYDTICDILYSKDDLYRHPITESVTYPDEARAYLDKFWLCPKEERQRIIENIQKYNITEDDYTDEFEISLEWDERSEYKPSQKDFIAASEFMHQNGMDKNITDKLKIDTGRYVNITYVGDNDIEITIDAYELPLQLDDKHSFLRLDTEGFDVIELDIDEYKFNGYVSEMAAREYQEIRDELIYSAQHNESAIINNESEKETQHDWREHLEAGSIDEALDQTRYLDYEPEYDENVDEDFDDNLEYADEYIDPQEPEEIITKSAIEMRRDKFVENHKTSEIKPNDKDIYTPSPI